MPTSNDPGELLSSVKPPPEVGESQIRGLRDLVQSIGNKAKNEIDNVIYSAIKKLKEIKPEKKKGLAEKILGFADANPKITALSKVFSAAMMPIDVLSESLGLAKDIDELRKPDLKVEALKNMLIQTPNGAIPKAINELESKAEERHKDLLIGDPLTKFLLGIQAYINESGQSNQLQNALDRISEILYFYRQESIDIIKSRKLPQIIRIINLNDSINFIFKNPSCSKEHEFMILQSDDSLINKIREILGITLGFTEFGLDLSMTNDLVKDIIESGLFMINYDGNQKGKLEIDTTKITGWDNYKIDQTTFEVKFERLTTYQFSLLYLQLFHKNTVTGAIDNILTAFYNEGSKKFNICNLCPTE